MTIQSSGIKKARYKQFCLSENDIPIFSKDWWLDAVCGQENWDVALVEEKNEIIASMPYYKRGVLGLSLLSMPIMTQYLGIYFKYPDFSTQYKQLHFEKTTMNALLDQLPVYHYFHQHFSPQIKNWLPFYWRGFRQSTRYTYVIEGVDKDSMLANCNTNRRRSIKKAQKNGVTVFEGSDIDVFYHLNSLTFKSQGMSVPYSKDFVKILYKACSDQQAVKLLFAKDADDTIISSAFIVYDEKAVYYLASGTDPKRKELNSIDLLLLEAIYFAIDTNRRFDFEGSMIEGIENYFKSFNAVQTPYFSITKSNSILIPILRWLKSFR